MLTVFVQKLLWLGQLGSNQSTVAQECHGFHYAGPILFISSIQIQSFLSSLNFCPEWAFNGICVSIEYAFQKKNTHTHKNQNVHLPLNHLRWESSFLFLQLSLTLIVLSTLQVFLYSSFCIIPTIIPMSREGLFSSINGRTKKQKVHIIQSRVMTFTWSVWIINYH